MYWRLIGSPDPSWVGGAASLGATAPQTTWVFAEGAAAPNFESFYLLLNPNSAPITVHARFLPETGMPTLKTIDDPAAVACDRLPERRARQHRRRRVDVHVRFAAVPGRALDLLGRRPRRGHQRHRGLVGSDASGTSPRARRAASFDTYLLLANPGANDATVRLTLFIEGVGRFTAFQPELLKTVRAGSRVTIYMNDFLSALEIGRRPCGRQPARQVVQHQDRGAGRRRSGGRGRGALLELGRRQLLAQRDGGVRHPAVAHPAAAPPRASPPSLAAGPRSRDFPTVLSPATDSRTVRRRLDRP